MEWARTTSSAIGIAFMAPSLKGECRNGHPGQACPPPSPWQNGFAERLIGSIRRECVDYFIILGEAHLRRILRTYARYYNDIRTRWS